MKPYAIRIIRLPFDHQAIEWGFNYKVERDVSAVDQWMYFETYEQAYALFKEWEQDMEFDCK